MRTRLRRGHRGALASLLAASLLSAPAPAQTDTQRAGARAVATEGYQAMREGRWADAVDRFKRAESLVHAPPHLLYLARAYAKLGQLVESHETYQKLTREMLAPKAPDVFVSAQADGVKELAQLEPRMPTLRIDVPSSYGHAVVTMDGQVVPEALLGLASPVDPGEHKIRATADGAASDLASVNVAEGAHETFAITFKPLPSGPRAATVAPPPPATNAITRDATPTSTDTSRGFIGLRIAGITALAVGVAGIGVGVGFALASHGEKNQGDALCPDGACPTSDIQQINSYNSAATRDGSIAVTGFVAGGVVAAVGATLLVLSARSHREQTATTRVSPWVGLGSAGVEGSF